MMEAMVVSQFDAQRNLKIRNNITVIILVNKEGQLRDENEVGPIEV
jgi:hypothetical protein